jgi:sortase A
MHVRVQTRWRWTFAPVLVLFTGMCLVLGGAVALVSGRLTEWQDRAAFSNLASTQAGNPANGTSLAVVKIPRLELAVLVRAGVGEDVLSRGAGWIPDTALPGAQGNSGIAAHRDTFFSDLRHIRLGDEIVVESGGVERRYRVSDLLVVSPGDLHILDPTPNRALTLVTCYPFNYLGAAPERFIVRAVNLES